MNRKIFVLRLAVLIAMLLSLTGLPGIPVQAAQPNESGLNATPIVDGVVDASYGPVIASDPAGDGNGNGPMDLTNLWVTQDSTYFYFAFEVNTDLSANNWGKYAIYIDTTNDANGATSDAWGRAVTVSDPHKPEYGIYSWLDAAPYDAADSNVVQWTGSAWDWGSAQTLDAVAFGAGATSIIEWSVAKSKLGNPSQIWVEVWDTGGGGSDNAQDTLNFPANDWNAADWSTTAVLSVSTPVVSVDGLVDAAYGAPRASDSAGDGNGNAVMDLLDLYVTEDASSYYFAYTINADIAATNWGKYAIYIDTTNDANGAITDAWGRNVIASNPHKPEYAFYTYVDSAPYGVEDIQTFSWNGSAWDGTASVLSAGLTAGTPSVIEWQVDKADLGNPDTIWMEVWGTGGGADPTQDTINDPAEDWNASDWATTSVISNSTEYPLPAEPPHASHDNNIWWGDLGHNSRDTLYRNPGGPVTNRYPVTLRLRAASGDLTAAQIRLYNDRTNTQTTLNMALVLDDGTYEWWEATVPASADPTVYWYRFIAIDGTDTDYYEDDAARTMGWGEAFDETNDYSYQLTVYDAAFQTPDWIKDAVVYQVFPDRFRDGDPTNNKPAGTFFYGEPGGTVYRSLTTDWNEEICDPRAAGTCAGTYSKNFYGGDLAGLLEKLDYLEGLGVNTIYLNPIFESPSNHGYDTTDYLALNPIFGDADDFNALVTEINNRGMHLILDGVFNHVSSDSIYFDRYNQYAEVGACESNTSPYRSWFYFTPADPVGTGPCVGDDGTPGGSDYESWWGYDSLPKLRANEAPVRELIWDYDTDPTTTVAGYWMQSADGWRLDVGADVDPGTINDPANDYWEGFRATVHAANPDGYITGEEWGIANSWLLGGEWDAVMNYQFSSAVLSYWRDETFVDNDHNSGSSAGELAPLTAAQFDERIQNLMERYAPESLEAMLNLFGSHDTSRALFMLDHNADLNDPSVYANPNYDWSDAINRLKGAVIIQMTMPGAPTIYYGDEVGLVGPMAYSGGKWEDDPYNRQPYPWLDETGLPFYTSLQSQPNQDALYDYYAVLTAARNAHPALRTGDYRTLLVDNDAELYVYGRRIDGSDAALVFINRSDALADVSINLNTYLPYDSSFMDVLSLATYTATDNQLEHVQVPANSGAVLVITSLMTASPDPTMLSVGGVGDTWITLDWTAAAGADGYYVYRALLSGGTYELLGATAGLTYTDATALPGQTYYYLVKSHNGTTGLLGEPSNEVSAMPHYAIDWANLQWPATITKTINTTPTENIYGQVYITGVTDPAGAAPGLIAQAGYGPADSDPNGHASWIWVDAVFYGQSGINDEYQATFLPESAGIYDYAYRYSTDGGATWLYADLDGTLNDYQIDQAGVMTINISSDDAPPTIPTISIADWGADYIALEWTAATDDIGVYAYDLYRSTDDLTYTKIARILDPELTYTDLDVVTNGLYYYKIQAIDTSFNFGDFSDVVSHLAEPKQVAVTFEITVPAFTPGTVYLTRFINPDGTVGGWDPAATPLTQQSDTLWSQTFNILDGTVLEFKFTRGSWETVVKGADGNEELPNLSLTVDYGTDGTQLYQYTVLNWRDPIVTTFTPADGALDVPAGTTVTATWSQEMAEDTCLTLSDGVTEITGLCYYDSLTDTVVFTPDSSLAYGTTYTAAVTGQVDWAGDVQQVPVTWSFTTVDAQAGVVLTPETAAQSGNPGADVSYTLTVENTGDLEDTFDISVAGAWTAVPSLTEITVPAGGTDTFTVTVSVPADALAGASDAATVTITSQADDTATDSSTLTTSANTVYGVTLTPATAADSGNPGTDVTYTLTVTNTGNISDDFTLATGATVWTTVIAPTTITDLAPGATAEVTVTVSIPGTATGGDTDVADVTVTSTGDGTVTDSSELTTTASILAGVLLTPETAANAGYPGATVTYTLTVENTGNAEDTFDVVVDSIWTSTPSVAEITLGAGATTTFDVAVTIPADALAGALDVATVSVTSQADDTVTDTAALTTTTNAVYGMAVTPATMSGQGMPGQGTLYLLTVHNTGNINDTYTITVDSDWAAVPDPVGTINVAAGSTAVLRVTVIIPLNAQDGASDTATVTLVSQGDNTVSDTSTLTTTAYLLKVYLPLIVK